MACRSGWLVWMPSSRMVTTTPFPVMPLPHAGCTFMSNPPLAPWFRCHCELNMGSPPLLALKMFCRLDTECG